MCNWKSWFWPGLVTTALLTALTGWFLSSPVEQDLALRAGEQLKVAQPWASVTFDGRDATISGVAENDIQQREAANIAHGTYGVRVAANTTTLPAVAAPFTLNMIKDAAGTTLSGNYATSEAKQALLASIEKAMPGIAIKDELSLASGIPAGFDGLAAFGASQLAEMTSGEVKLSNLEYSVKGTPIDLGAYETLTAMGIQLPASGVLKSSDISLPDLGRAYEFSATLDGNTVNLNGYAPSVKAKEDIEAQAKQVFSGKTVNNLLKLAGGAPKGFADLVGFGFKQLSTIGNGGFSISDLNYSVKGTPADTATYDAAIKLAENGLPAGAVLAASDLVKPVVPEPEPAVQTQPVAATPFSWSAVRDATTLKVAGSSPSIEAAAAAVELSKRRFVGLEVADTQLVGTDAPVGAANAQSGLLKALSYLNDGKASIVGTEAILEGSVPSQSALELVLKIAKAEIPTDYLFVNKVEVKAPPAQETPPLAIVNPYVWTANSSADGLKLSGSVLSADVSASLFSLAKSKFANVVNEQRVLSPSPANFVKAQNLSILALAALKQGQANITDVAISIKGDVTSEAEKASVIKMATEGLPKGYGLTTELTVLASAAKSVVEAPAVTACLSVVSTLMNTSQIKFESAKAVIQADSFELLSKIGSALASCKDAKIEISGHTDSDGDGAYNEGLSDARAKSVRDYLVNAGVSGANISSKGYGESQPIAANDTTENKAKNRRIEFRSVQ